MSAEADEQQKLTATWLNTLASGSVTAGVIAPIVSLQTGIGNATLDSDFVSGSVLWFSVGVVLHIVACLCLIGFGEP